jgi:hypothetical protein
MDSDRPALDVWQVHVLTKRNPLPTQRAKIRHQMAPHLKYSLVMFTCHLQFPAQRPVGGNELPKSVGEEQYQSDGCYGAKAQHNLHHQRAVHRAISATRHLLEGRQRLARLRSRSLQTKLWRTSKDIPAALLQCSNHNTPYVSLTCGSTGE